MHGLTPISILRNTLNVGIIGCGKISDAYFQGCAAFEVLNVTTCADLNPAAAQAKAEQHKLRAKSVDELLADQEIDIVVNLTIPQAHVAVNLRAVEAGKHVFCEKPFALDRADGQRVLAAAEAKGVRVGCAPDTFLGGGIQTCRKLIDDGLIGDAISATAFFACHGHESWHPNPDFYYQLGGGPMFDMGPYYLTALVNLLGPMKSVIGETRRSFPERTITSEPRRNEKIRVEVPTHFTGVVDFANGALGTLLMSFDLWGHHLPCLEVYGTKASISVPDPNRHDGIVQIKTASRSEWEQVPLTHTDQSPARGIGVADMALAILKGRPHRANGELANHVTDAMQSFEESSQLGRRLHLQTSCHQPAALRAGLLPGELDD